MAAGQCCTCRILLVILLAVIAHHVSSHQSCLDLCFILHFKDMGVMNLKRAGRSPPSAFSAFPNGWLALAPAVAWLSSGPFFFYGYASAFYLICETQKMPGRSVLKAWF